MSNFIKNYHWRSLDTTKWAKTWFEENLVGLEADGVKVETIAELEGDCELGMRKAKLITIYDLRITSHWSGYGSTGTLTAVEVAHDMEESEYRFESTLNSGGKSEVEQKAKAGLADKMRSVFQRFPKAMVDTHGANFYAKTGTQPPGESPSNGSPAASGSSTPVSKTAPTSEPAGASVAAAPTTSATAGGKSVSTTTVRTEGEFMCGADDLWSLLTDEKRIPTWSRNPAKMKPEKGAEMALFGGNIKGEVVDVDPPTSFATTWRAPNWPEGHYGQLKSTIRQGTNSTNLKLELTGVPVGQVEETERNLDIFYIRSLKQIGSALPPLRRRRSSFPPDYPTPAVKPSTWSLVLTSAVPMLLSIGLIGLLGYGMWAGPTGQQWREARAQKGSGGGEL